MLPPLLRCIKHVGQAAHNFDYTADPAPEKFMVTVLESRLGFQDVRRSRIGLDISGVCFALLHVLVSSMHLGHTVRPTSQFRFEIPALCAFRLVPRLRFVGGGLTKSAQSFINLPRFSNRSLRR